MIQILLLNLLLILPILALAQDAVPQSNGDCPTGYRSSGDYCKPFTTTADQIIIQKSGNTCPTGYYTSGNYCKRLSSSDRDALPKESGKVCPTGWRKAGDYCVNK
tara:strand:- start:973 stop:1287 length:315 start_codon:yes stop_codon:yes gene_type:complete